MSNELKIFCPNASRQFGEKLSRSMGLSLSEHEEREFEDGEHKIRPLTGVRNKDVYIVHSLFGDKDVSVNDKLCRLLFFTGALRDASAAQITVVTPYLCYSRKDRKTKSRDPVTSRYIAQIFESMGIDRIVTMDVHNLQAYQNSFRCPGEHLSARELFAEYFETKGIDGELAVMSPDYGGAKRAEDFRKALIKRTGKEIPLVVMEKQRSKGVITGETLIGDAKDRSVIIIDDLISSGSTMHRAAIKCKEAGSLAVYAAATHPVFGRKIKETLIGKALDEIVVTNTVDLNRLDISPVPAKVKILNAAPLFGEAIKRIHTGGSINELMHNE